MGAEWPDLRSLELLVAVADTGSLNAASQLVGIAQPNASRMIGALERQVGAPLLRRSPNGSTATTDGALVIAQARELLVVAGALLESVGSRREQRASKLSIGASLTINEYLLPRWLADLRDHLPAMRPELNAMNSEQVFAAVDAGSCAVGFVETPSIPRRFERQLVHIDEMYVVVAPTHPWAQRKGPISGVELAATPLVTREPGSGTRSTLERALAGHDLVAPLQELGSNAAVLASACAGLGPAALSRLVVETAIAAGALRRVSVEGISLQRYFHAVWPALRPLRGAAAELVDIAARQSAPVK